jgi:hypothetical protein
MGLSFAITITLRSDVRVSLCLPWCRSKDASGNMDSDSKNFQLNGVLVERLRSIVFFSKQRNINAVLTSSVPAVSLCRFGPSPANPRMHRD